MENDKRSVSDLVNRICQKGGRQYCATVYAAWNDDPNYIINNYQKGYVGETDIINLLKKSVTNRYIKLFLPDILFLLVPESITDRVLDKALQYPGRYRETLLSLLGHIWLKPTQLELLNRRLSTPEAFYKLFDIYITEERVPLSFFSAFLDQNMRYVEEFQTCLNLLITKKGNVVSEEKIKCVKKHLVLNNSHT